MKFNKIKDLYVHSFRGIPNELFIEFTDKKGNAISSIIYGDNGSGKSSIVDAIEFNLQGRIERSTVINSPFHPSVISLFHKPSIGALTRITFSDNSLSERGINIISKKGKTYYESNNNLLHKNFALAPIVLRRNDIISYNIMPTEKRQVLFLSFLYSQFIKIEDVEKNALHWENDPYIVSLTENYISLKRQRREILNKIAALCKIRTNKIPFSTPEKLTAFLYSKFGVKGFKKNHQNKQAIPEFYKRDSALNQALPLKDDVIKITQEIKQVKDEVERLLNPNNYGILVKDRREANADFIKSAGAFLSESFKEISNEKYISEIKLELGHETTASLDITVQLANGRLTTPNKIFSEGNYDLLILLLYVSLIRACVGCGQVPILVLDDTLQSVDSTIRVKLINYILKKCKNWQFFITCHDELWLNQLNHLFNANGVPCKVLKTRDWSFNQGVIVEDMTNHGIGNSLEEALATNNKQIIASQTGVFLENMCQKLSVSLSVSVHRRKDDKYTIGDLWPSIMKTLKETSIYNLMETINCELSTRNILGCHANEWALSMSDGEVKDFANHVLELYHKVFCRECLEWISRPNNGAKIVGECRCRALQYSQQEK